VCLALAIAMTACIGADTAQLTPRTYALLANNHLLVADAATGTAITELTLPGPAAVAAPLRALALSSDRGSLFVLVSEANGRALVAAIDTQTVKVTATFELGRDLRYRGIAIGPRTARLYLFANRESDAVVRVLDPSNGGTQDWLARASNGRYWYVYQGDVSADESALFISYHGADTTGIDRFDIQPTGLARCNIPSAPESGCFRTHGSFALFGNELFAATGQPFVTALDAKTGVKRRDYQLGLEGNHLMEFAIDPTAGIYAVGSCRYNRGLAVADLASHQYQVLVPPGQLSPICGERIGVLDDGALLVVAKTAASVPALAPGEILVLSGDGRVLRTIPTSAEPVDLLISH
jgi:DNA-binding beta-propeller fold protein YncE